MLECRLGYAFILFWFGYVAELSSQTFPLSYSLLALAVVAGRVKMTMMR